MLNFITWALLVADLEEVFLLIDWHSRYVSQAELLAGCSKPDQVKLTQSGGKGSTGKVFSSGGRTGSVYSSVGIFL